LAWLQRSWRSDQLRGRIRGPPLKSAAGLVMRDQIDDLFV
jgi:hypothetical protein